MQPVACATQGANAVSDSDVEDSDLIHDAGCSFEKARARDAIAAPRAARVQIRVAVNTLLTDGSKMAGMGPLCHVAWAAHLPRVSEIAPLAGAARDAAVTASQTADQLMQQKREAALYFWQERKRMTAPAWEAPPGTPESHA